METLYQVYNPTNVPVNLVIDGEEVKIEGRAMVYLKPELAHKLINLMPMLEYTEVVVETSSMEEVEVEKPALKKPSKPVKKSKR